MTDFPVGLPFEEARAVLRGVAAAHRLPVEHAALARCHGRVLAQDILAPIALQPFDNSAMDGYACRQADLRAKRGGRVDNWSANSSPAAHWACRWTRANAFESPPAPRSRPVPIAW